MDQKHKPTPAAPPPPPPGPVSERSDVEADGKSENPFKCINLEEFTELFRPLSERLLAERIAMRQAANRRQQDYTTGDDNTNKSAPHEFLDEENLLAACDKLVVQLADAAERPETASNLDQQLMLLLARTLKSQISLALRNIVAERLCKANPTLYSQVIRHMLRIGCLSQTASSRGNLHVDFFVTLLRQVYLCELAPKTIDDQISFDRAMLCLTRSLADGDVYGPNGLLLPQNEIRSSKRVRPHRDGQGRQDFSEFQRLIAELRNKHAQRSLQSRRARDNSPASDTPLTRLEKRFAAAAEKSNRTEDSSATLRLHPAPAEVTS